MKIKLHSKLYKALKMTKAAATQQMRTIVDKNIYYYLADGSLKIDSYKNLDLHATYNTLYEAATSYKLSDTTNRQYIRGAIQQMMSTDKQVMKALYATPLAYPLAMYYSDINTDNTGRVESLRYFLDRIAHDTLADEVYSSEEFKQFLDEENSIIKDLSIEINETLKGHKIQLGKKTIEEAGYDTYAKDLFIDWIQITDEKKHKTDIIDLNQFELFLKVASIYFKEIALDKRVFKENDFFDLTNLIYVQPDDLYFTNDGAWINLIKEAGLEHYLVINKKMRDESDFNNPSYSKKAKELMGIV